MNLTYERTCPDCGVGLGQPHINECDVEPCSVCGGQRISCECKGHDPMQSVWRGEWPFPRHATEKPPEPTASEEVGFVICEWLAPRLTPQRKEEPKAPDEPYQSPALGGSDDVLSANGRWVYRNFMMEPIHRNGHFTGEWRVCRRWPDPYWYRGRDIRWEAVLPSREEAKEWGEHHTASW